MVTLAVDCMGGDHGPSVTLLACKQFLQVHPDAQLLLVGLPQALAHFHHPRASVVAASEVVTMEDPLEVALRRKKDSSMRISIEQVRDGKADAAISAGNTGALMAIARYVLKTLDGIDRPAIAGQFPNAKGGATTTTQLTGNRQVQTTLTRATLAAPLRSTLTVRRVIKGTATNPRDATETNKFTQWTTTATTAGVTDTVIWNRNADFSVTYDLIGATSIAGATSDRIFVTYNGIVVGPYTAAQIASRFSTALQDPSAF